MIDYIASLGHHRTVTNQELTHNLLHASNYQVEFEHPLIKILTSGKPEKSIQIYKFPNNHGIIIGKLFKRNALNSTDVAPTQISINDTRSIVESHGRYLIDNFWGRYVAFIINHENNCVRIIRDPTGAIHSYTYFSDGSYYFFSNINDFLEISKVKTSFNTNHIAFNAITFQVDQPDTGLNGIGKIIRGHSYEYYNNSVKQLATWKPSDYCTKYDKMSIDDAAYLMREAIINATKTWASQFDSIIHTLSGGLDSSIVLSALKETSHDLKVTCLNHYSEGVDSDERNMAKIAADHCGYSIIHKHDDADESELNDLENFAFCGDLEPTLFFVLKGKFMKELEISLNSEAFFSGEGGDSIFYQGAEQCPVDYLYHNGLRKNFLTECLHNSQLRNKSIYSTISSSVKDYYTGHKFDLDALIRSTTRDSLVSKKILDNLDCNERVAHFMDGMQNYSPAKQRHVLWTRFTDLQRWPQQPQYDTIRILPLLSQPVVEASYRIPTYLTGARGIDRAVARIGFRNLLARQNLLRQSKGGVDDYYQRVFHRNRSFIRRYIDGGYLLSTGILDEEKVLPLLRDEKQSWPQYNVVMLRLLGAEFWMRHMARYM